MFTRQIQSSTAALKQRVRAELESESLTLVHFAMGPNNTIMARAKPVGGVTPAKRMPKPIMRKTKLRVIQKNPRTRTPKAD